MVLFPNSLESQRWDDNHVLVNVVVDVCYIMLDLEGILCMSYVVFQVAFVGVYLA